MTESSTAAPEERPARLVVVAGSGRSGTSTISGVLGLLGLYIPQPEVPGGRSNPRGHFEPQWVVSFQQSLLGRSKVKLADPRPDAFRKTAQLGLRPRWQDQLQSWLKEQFAISPQIVVKDPRNSWFLPMWQEAAKALSVSPRYVTMLRHPAEVLGSKNSYYHSRESEVERRAGDTSRLAGWINVALHTESSTRNETRVFVHYTDLVSDWKTTVSGILDSLDVLSKEALDERAVAAVESFIDPDLHRVRVTWDDVSVPTRLQELAEAVWGQLSVLAESGGHDKVAETSLDDIRREYDQMYADAYALTSYSVAAQVQQALAKKAAEQSPSLRHRIVAQGRRTVEQLRDRVGRGAP